MIRIALSLLFLAGAATAFVGCSQDAEEPAPADVLEPGERTLDINPPAEAEKSAVALPEGLPDWVPISPSLEITEIEVIDLAERQFRILADTRANVDEVMEAYLEKFQADGWEEDMVMTLEGTSIVGFIKDGLLVMVESIEGGRGSLVTITTGNV